MHRCNRTLRFLRETAPDDCIRRCLHPACRLSFTHVSRLGPTTYLREGDGVLVPNTEAVRYPPPQRGVRQLTACHRSVKALDRVSLHRSRCHGSRALLRCRPSVDRAAIGCLDNHACRKFKTHPVQRGDRANFRWRPSVLALPRG